MRDGQAHKMRQVTIEDAFASYTLRKELAVVLYNTLPLVMGRVTELLFHGNEMHLRVLTHKDEEVYTQEQVKVVPCPLTGKAICQERSCELHYMDAPVLLDNDDITYPDANAVAAANATHRTEDGEGFSRHISGPASAHDDVYVTPSIQLTVAATGEVLDFAPVEIRRPSTCPHGAGNPDCYC